MAISITKDQVISIAVKVIGIAGGYAVGRGWLNGDQLTSISSLVPQIVTVAAVAGPLFYSIYANLRKTQIAKVAAMDGVDKVVMTTEAEAQAQKPSNVVGPAG